MKTRNREELKGLTERSVRGVAGCCVALIAVVAALIVFAAVCAGLDLKQTDPNAVLIGVVVLGILAVALGIALMIALIVAHTFYRKLRSLPPENGAEDRVQEENK